ncbi:MAG: Hsp20/alpha crystallin family protein [Rhodopila sp.]|nr:Hsp20/alpha crystallin family protein [Rhodopila sp.]
MAQNPITQHRPASMIERASPFYVLQRQMNRLLEDVFGPDAGAFPSVPEPVRGILSPRVELTEGETELRVTAELPGVREQAIEVSLDDDILTLTAEKKAETKEENENPHFTERSYGLFQRSLRLPFQVDPDEVKAAFDNGVLTITIPKPKGREQKRRIEVRSGSQTST